MNARCGPLKGSVSDYFSSYEREHLIPGKCVVRRRGRVMGTHAREEEYGKSMCRVCGCEVHADQYGASVVLGAGFSSAGGFGQ